MSGGVDSSVAALCLRDAGYDVAGVTMRLKPRHMLNDAQAAAVEKEIADAAAVCAKLGIEHFAPDFSAAFEENVIGAFVSAYKNGETPNPCFRCNQTIKFGVMLDWALAHGFDKIATGHYAEIVEEGGRTKLKRSPDQKDQSYFLSGLTPAQLSRTLLPLNRMGKAEKGAETIWCEDAGDTNLTAHSIVDADDFVAANDALEKGQKKAAYRPLHFYASEEEALMAYNDHVIGPHCPIGVRRTMTVDGVSHTAVVESTPGRIIFNQNIPQDLGFVDRTDPAHVCDYEVTFTCGKKQLGKIIDKCITKYGFNYSAGVLDLSLIHI